MSTNAAPKAEVPATKPTGKGGLTGFLQEKTGVTGAWTLGVGVGAYAISKELYIINSEVSVVDLYWTMLVMELRAKELSACRQRSKSSAEPAVLSRAVSLVNHSGMRCCPDTFAYDFICIVCVCVCMCRLLLRL